MTLSERAKEISARRASILKGMAGLQNTYNQMNTEAVKLLGQLELLEAMNAEQAAIEAAKNVEGIPERDAVAAEAAAKEVE
jgi:hypothetical protein